MRTQIASNVSLTTRGQADELVKKRGYSVRDVVTIGIRMLYQEEFSVDKKIVEIEYDYYENPNAFSIGDEVYLKETERYYTGAAYGTDKKAGDTESYFSLSQVAPTTTNGQEREKGNLGTNLTAGSNYQASLFSHGKFRIEKMTERKQDDIVTVEYSLVEMMTG